MTEGLGPEERAVLAKLGMDVKTIQQHEKSLVRNKKNVARKAKKFRVCTIKRVVREIECENCSWVERRWIIMREMQLFYWEGERVIDGSFTLEQADKVLKHHVLACQKCPEFIDTLDVDELRIRLKKFYSTQAGTLSDYVDEARFYKDAVDALQKGGG
jgi:hypothetical protein